ncbi:MAG: CFI-box-CTERM domain-containing protein [Candidatus Thorarchaeota archaeon]
MPKKIECRYCGRKNEASAVECGQCGASLSDSWIQAYCDRCGVPLGEGTDPVGNCVTCKESVFLCEKHKNQVIGEEIYCKEHESECFIATAVFGTPLDPKIDILRDFRDQWLLSNPIGRAAVYTYYEISPPIARFARRNDIMKEVLRRTVVQPALKLAQTLFGKEY